MRLKVLPFAGIAVIWFIGVIRDRIGEREAAISCYVLVTGGRQSKWTGL